MNLNLSPSLMCMNLKTFADDIKFLDNKIDSYHIDIMDGHYVKNITLSSWFISQIRKISKTKISTHLMMTNPEDFIIDCINAGSDTICLHTDIIEKQAFRLINIVKDSGKEFGIVLNPATIIEVIKPYIHLLDKITVMTVDPGFAGQKFISEAVGKIKELSNLKKENGYKYKIEVYTIENNQVIELESDIEDMPVLTWLEFNYNNNFNVFTKSYDEGEYLVIENYVNQTGDGGMGVYLRMYKMEGNELILQRDCSNTIYYAMGYEYDYDGMTYTYNQTTLYSDISQEEGYDIYNFQKEECRRQFDNDVSQNMSEFDMGQIWSGYMENYYNAMLSNDNIYINDYMKEASLRQSGITDLFRMEYMPDSTSGGNITFYNYNGDYLSKFK